MLPVMFRLVAEFKKINYTALYTLGGRSIHTSGIRDFQAVILHAYSNVFLGTLVV